MGPELFAVLKGVHLELHWQEGSLQAEILAHRLLVSATTPVRCQDALQERLLPALHTVCFTSCADALPVNLQEVAAMSVLGRHPMPRQEAAFGVQGQDTSIWLARQEEHSQCTLALSGCPQSASSAR